jgi:acyl phosphate:glycerol-3-phosphate acyltransferase
MNYWHLFFAFVTAYLLGSIPSAVWYGEAYFGIDVRKHGSGNAGATNTFRVLGKKAGTMVLLMDIFKGWTATMLAVILYHLSVIEDTQILTFKLLLGAMSVLGHLFSVFVKFKGGKGVATSLGMVLAMNPQVALMCIAIFLVVLIVSHYVSLSSIIAAFSFPMMLLFGVFGPANVTLIVFGFLLFLVVLIAHRQNLTRLAKGTESKTYLWK